jgi:hypothetical protein
MLKSSFLILVLAALLGSKNLAQEKADKTAASQAETAKIVKVHWAKGGFRRGDPAGQHVIRTDEAWKKLWGDAPPAEMKIDFAKHQALVIFVGQQGRREPDVASVRVLDRGKFIEAVAHFRPPLAAEAPVLQDIIAPYHVVVIDKTDKPIRFVLAYSQEDPKANDYLKDGKLTERIELVNNSLLSDGLGRTGSYIMIEPDGSWAAGTMKGNTREELNAAEPQTDS